MRPGRWMGVMSLVNVIVMQYTHEMFQIFFNAKISDLSLQIAYGIFIVIWGAVFGSGAIKKIKGKIDQ